MKIIRTPAQALNASVYAEQWVRSVREECLDKLIIVNESHLRRTLDVFVVYYNEARLHQEIEQAFTNGDLPPTSDGSVRCRQVLGGIIHDYYREAA
jgi:hypothetical protein